MQQIIPYIPREIMKEIIIECPPISLHTIWIYVSKEIYDIVRDREREEGD